MSYYIHAVPGRIRVKIPSVKGNAELAEAVQDTLKAIGGVTAVSSQLLTGSIVVNYDPSRLTSQDILEALVRKGHIDRARLMTMDDYFTAGAAKAQKALARALLGVFMDQALAGSQLAFLSILL